MAQLLTSTRGEIKSIPISKLSPDAFTTIMGEGRGGGAAIYELYESVPWLRRGTDIIADACQDMPYALLRDGEPLDDPDKALGFPLRLPKLFGNWALWFVLFGAAYAMMEVENYKPSELRSLHPSTMQPLWDALKGLTGFKRTVGTVVTTYDVKEVVYVWERNHRKEIGAGVSRATSALLAAGLLKNIEEFSSHYFSNGAISPTLVEIPKGTGKADRERIENNLQRAISGIKNAFRITAIEGGDAVTGVGDFKAVPLGSPPKDLAMVELSETSRQNVATALGVPQSLLFSQASAANIEQDRLSFYTTTVLPMWGIFADALNEQLFAGMGLHLQDQHSKLEMFQRQETSKAYGLAQLWTSGAVPREYVWDMLDLPDDYRTGTFYKQAAANTNSGNAAPQLAKPPDLPGVPTVDAPEGPTMEMKADLERWQRLAVKRYKEGKPEKALQFTSDSIPAGIAGAVRGGLKRAATADRIGDVFRQALVWEGYP